MDLGLPKSIVNQKSAFIFVLYAFSVLRTLGSPISQKPVIAGVSCSRSLLISTNNLSCSAAQITVMNVSSGGYEAIKSLCIIGDGDAKINVSNSTYICAVENIVTSVCLGKNISDSDKTVQRKQSIVEIVDRCELDYKELCVPSQYNVKNSLDVIPNQNQAQCVQLCEKESSSSTSTVGAEDKPNKVNGCSSIIGVIMHFKPAKNKSQEASSKVSTLPSSESNISISSTEKENKINETSNVVGLEAVNEIKNVSNFTANEKLEILNKSKVIPTMENLVETPARNKSDSGNGTQTSEMSVNKNASTDKLSNPGLVTQPTQRLISPEVISNKSIAESEKNDHAVVAVGTKDAAVKKKDEVIQSVSGKGEVKESESIVTNLSPPSEDNTDKHEPESDEVAAPNTEADDYDPVPGDEKSEKTVNNLGRTDTASSGLKKPKDQPQEVVTNGFVITDEDDSSGYFGYLVSVIGFIGICFLLFHNKKRIIAIVLEGRRPSGGRRRSTTTGTSYRKLENNFD